MRDCHRFTAGSAWFDEDNLVSHAGLVPLLGLAEQTRLPQIIAEKVSHPDPISGKAGQTSDSRTPPTPTCVINSTKITHAAVLRIEA